MISLILIFAMILALIFSFWTGFTDAAYAISTVIGTRTLKPIQAVGLATVGNLIGMMFGSAVALTIGTGVISENVTSGEVIISALAGALIFDVISSWIYSLPISETHVLIGGLVGAGIAAGGFSVVKVQGIIDKIVILLIYYGYLSEFAVPFWVMLASYITLSLGTLLGGWKVVKTMATKITHLKPYQGFSAEVTSSLILGSTAFLGMPVSSTHVANGAIMGVGLCQRTRAVKWGMTRKIIWAWILSMPLSAVFSFIIFNIIKLLV